MSSQAVAWAIVHQAGGMSAKAVLLSLANYANEYGECWASQATIADGAECSVRQVRRILADLAERGLIERERRGGAGKGRETDMIRLRMRELPVILTSKRREETQPDNLAGSPATGQGVRGASGHPVRGATGQMRGGNRTIVSDNPKIPKERTPLPPGFDEVWAVWPKHIRASSKRIASGRLARLGVTGPEIVAAASAYLRSPDATKDGRKYVPALEVWLNKQAEFWLERSRPDAAELRRRQELFEFDGTWADEWGPRPSQANGGQP